MSLKEDNLLARVTTPDFSLVITDTVARTEVDGYAFQAVSDCVIADIAINNKAVGSNTEAQLVATGVTITAGSVLLMAIDSIQLTSGVAIVYQSRGLNQFN
jgi:hypothetical protein